MCLCIGFQFLNRSKFAVHMADHPQDCSKNCFFNVVFVWTVNDMHFHFKDHTENSSCDRWTN